MVPYEQVAHRASALKQQNKKHNVLGHRTKGQVTSLNKGRVNIISAKKAQKTVLSKLQRRHQAKQIQSHKRNEVINKKRFLGTESKPPFLITVISLHDDEDFKEFTDVLENIDGTSVSKSEQGLLHISYSRLKQRFSFIIPPQKDLYAILDAAKVSDTVLFIWKYGETLSSEKENLLSCLKYQGMPTSVHTISGDEDIAQKKKIRAEKELKVTISSYFNDCPKLYSLRKYQDILLLFWQIGSHKRNEITFRDRRMHLIGENVAFIGKGAVGNLEVSGYVRGQNVTANDLIHIPGWGEFQIELIQALFDPHPMETNSKNQIVNSDDLMTIEKFGTPDPQMQESLSTTQELTERKTNDKTSISEDDEDCDDDVIEKPETKSKPTGVSDYQAAWLLSDDEDDTDEEDGQSTTMSESFTPKVINDEESVFNASSVDDDNDAMTMTDAGDDYDEGYDFDDDMNELQKVKAAKEDVSFPDEIDTPIDTSAKERFQGYRGLESFRTSPWIQNEDLPDDYHRIFQFGNFKHIKKSALKEKREGIEPGCYVKICLKDVPRQLYEESVSSSYPFLLFSLRKHEQKMAVLNIVLKSNVANHTDAIVSEEKLIFHMGIRRFCNNPIFSEHTNGDKHKLARYFHPGQTVMATMYAPVTYPPCPVSVFQRIAGKQVLVATGSVFSVNANRVICERVVLSGHPFKVNKKSAVIRYMFFNVEDINYFKNVELRTKWGRKGHIVEPLGTHGHMKCKFNGPMKSQDTVMMKLYKRVFPQWLYDPHVEKPYEATSNQSSHSKLTVTNLREFCQSLEPKEKKRKKVSFQNSIVK